MRHLQFLVIFSAVLLGQANPTPPVLPRSVPPATRPTPTGSVIHVHSGDNLQAIYDAATCGQDLVLDDGATFTGDLVFSKQCAAPNWILVEGTGCSGGTVAIPTYVTQANVNSASIPPIPAPTLTHYAKLTTGTGSSTIVTTNGSNVPGKYNYFGCLEVTSSVSSQNLIMMANGLTETVASQLGDHLMFDRMYVHGLPSSSTVMMTRGFLAVGSNISIVNNYLSNLYTTSQDAQGILGGEGPGPYLIGNNFISASTEPILFGGTGATIGYSCTVAASPAPTTTTATVNNCLDGASGSVSTPAVGTCLMFKTSASAPIYIPTDWTCITGNSSGALTFQAIHAAPISGTAKAVWGLIPSDITITRNYIYKPPTWNPSDPSYDGINRPSKNFIEDKYGSRWLVSGNAMVNSWSNGQSYAFNLNTSDQNGDCPWCFSSDVTVQNNIIKNISGAFLIIPTQTYSSTACPGMLRRVVLQNNLFWVSGGSPHIAKPEGIISLAGVGGTCTQTGGGVDSLQIIHNNFLGAGVNMFMSGNTPYNYTNLVIRDNITEFDQYRWSQPTPCAQGTPAYQEGTACMNGDISMGGLWSVDHNAIVNSGVVNGVQGVDDSVLTSRYGSMILPTLVDSNQGMNYSGVGFLNYSAINADYHNFALAAASPFHGQASDGTDPGVNFAQLDSAVGASSLTCDLNNDGKYDVVDVQLITNQASGISACTNDLDGNGTCNIIDVQRVVNAALGEGCRIGS